jgi:5-methylcytosine-specific restriction endonuclease McrA
MNMLPILWALKDAPVADAPERLILVALAETALSDGTRAMLARREIAEIALLDVKTVQRRLRKLVDRGLIAEGDQQAASHLPQWKRPKVYDLMIPCSAFPNIDQVNSDRDARGEEPLTPDNRPALTDAPPRTRRKDLGQMRGPHRPRTPLSHGVRTFVLERDDHRCVNCGSEDDLTIDHIYPWVLGGGNHSVNLRTLCRPCNSRKGDRLMAAEVKW